MGTFSFKSVGKTIDDVVQQSLVVTAPPVGIKTPLRLGTSSDGILAMNTEFVAAVADNFRNMLLTNHGERLALIDFGANLRKYVSEYYHLKDFDGTVMSSIKRTTAKYMPFIDLDSFKSEIANTSSFDDRRILRIRLTYNVAQLGVTGKMIEIMLALT